MQYSYTFARIADFIGSEIDPIRTVFPVAEKEIEKRIPNIGVFIARENENSGGGVGV
jgi:hypothetical protein